MWRNTGLVMLTVTLLLCTRAAAWWDTVLTAFRPVPLVQEYEAESLSGVDAAAIQSDPQADGGSGGKAVLLQPGAPGLAVDLNLKPGLYALFALLRNPAGTHGYGVVTLQVTEQKTGQTRSWSMPIIYVDTYNASAMLYFPAYAGGDYHATLTLEANADKVNPKQSAWRDQPDANLVQLLKTIQDSKPQALLCDRLELRDVFAGVVPGDQLKQRRMLTSDAQLAQQRQKFAADPQAAVQLFEFAPSFKLVQPPEWFTKPRAADARRQRNDDLWAATPDFNTAVGHGANAWNFIIGHDRAGTIPSAAVAYEQTGNAELGWDAAVMLIAMAEKYPAIDFLAQGVGKTTNLSSGADAFGINIQSGKNVYRGWAGPANAKILTAYDQLFDFIKDNQPLADYVATKIPGLKSPTDIIRFLDRNLLRHTIDAANRCQIEGINAPKALAPLILGPGPDADRLLQTGLFSKIAMNMSHRGGIDDHAISSFSRDGVHYIGSAGYLSDDLAEIADLLHRYREAGGPARFDLSDPILYPHISEASSTLKQVRVAGGFRVLQGDAGDLRNGREPQFTAFPPRILGGYGMSILESGQFQADPLRMNAVALTFGIGRGHAQHDTLNLEIFGQGCRVSPDLGGRHEGSNRGSPNMRSNRVHNLVEIDNRDFYNPFPGSATSATGWSTAFVPAPAAQFMEHHARASSHPDVSLYARQTALVAVPAANETPDVTNAATATYIFDVFRVQGGKLHTYCFHGAPTDALKLNVPLRADLDDAAKGYLGSHFAGSQRQGVATDMLQADWPMSPAIQKQHQGAAYQADKPVTTRLTLLNQADQRVLVGNAYSEQYQYNFPFLYVQTTASATPRASVYPAIIESFAGASTISSIRALPVTTTITDATRPVALEVRTTTGDSDLLYASGAPQDVTTIADKTVAQAKFALVSTDAAGLRAVQLVGGTKLEAPAQGISIQVPQAAYEGTITAVRYRERSLVLNQPLPANLLNGQWAQIGNGNGVWHSFKLEAVDSQSGGVPGTLVRHEKTARYFQSTVVGNPVPGQNAVECEIEPPVFGADPAWINGTTVTNEKQDKFARVQLTESDRWMHLGWPGYRTSWPNHLTLSDLPDADGDGKRTLTLPPVTDDAGKPKAAPLVMEITRLNPAGDTFYFARPADEAYQRGGWQYNFRRMRDEAGREFRAVYPGSSYLWMLDKNMTPADFTDADGDGQAKLSAYLYGPGDRFRLDTFVHLTRSASNQYLLQANTACTLTFTIPTNIHTVHLSPDGKTYQALKSTSHQNQLTVSLTAPDLATGQVWLKLSE